MATTMASQELFERLYQSIPDAILIVKEEGSILRVNQAAQQMFGYEAEELVGQQVEVLIPPKYAHRHIQNRIEFTKKPALRPMGLGLELYGMRKDGKALPVQGWQRAVGVGNRFDRSRPGRRTPLSRGDN